jgi:hypothetical protein
MRTSRFTEQLVRRGVQRGGERSHRYGRRHAKLPGVLRVMRSYESLGRKQVPAHARAAPVRPRRGSLATAPPPAPEFDGQVYGMYNSYKRPREYS